MDLTIAQVAERLNRHPDLVRRWVREGLLPAYKIGTYWFIKETDVAAFVEPGRKPWKGRERRTGKEEGQR